MEDKKLEEKLEIRREENLYKKLPLLIREIIIDSALPLPSIKGYVEKEIEEIKKITNDESDSAIEILKKHNQAYKD